MITTLVQPAPFASFEDSDTPKRRASLARKRQAALAALGVRYVLAPQPRPAVAPDIDLSFLREERYAHG
jgi:hypothetical protein